MIIAILSLFAVSATGTNELGGNPLEPAILGQAQCYQPDEQKKTCSSMATYRHISGSQYDNKAVVFVAPQGPVTLETVTPVFLKAGAVCGSITSEAVLAGKLFVAGQPLPEHVAAPALEQIAQALNSMMNKEICTTYLPSDKDLVAKISIDGVYQEGSDEAVKWVSPTDGYTVDR